MATATTLTRERVIDAAIGIIDREGADALSMRMMAGALGVTPMALYNHVASKRDLLGAVAERLVAGASFDHGKADWRDQVEACFRTLREMCLRHPGAARLMEIEGVAPAGVFAPMEVTVEALAAAGLPPDEAMKAYFTLVNFTLGQCAYETRGPFRDLEPGEAARAKRLSRKLEKRVLASGAGEAWDFAGAFDYGIALILDGIENRLRSGAASAS